jgi:hypothetical protein
MLSKVELLAMMQRDPKLCAALCTDTPEILPAALVRGGRGRCGSVPAKS